VSTLRSALKTFERQWLRPAGRKFRGRFRRWLGESARIDHLENRIESLEALVRELTGLAYLKLDDPRTDAGAQTEPNASPRPPREAA
jgi:hypothetical protein